MKPSFDEGAYDALKAERDKYQEGFENLRVGIQDRLDRLHTAERALREAEALIETLTLHAQHPEHAASDPPVVGEARDFLSRQSGERFRRRAES